MIKVTSPSNPRLRIARQLHSRTGSVKNSLFLMEGPRFISDQLNRVPPEWVLLSEEAGELARRVARMAEPAGRDILHVPPELFEDISDTETSQGIIAAFPLPEPYPEALTRDGIFLLLDGLSDPGNMGTVIRSAAAFGCRAVVTGRGSCFPFLPKVTRAAAGTNAGIPVFSDVRLPEFMKENSPGMVFVGADAAGDTMDLLHGETRRLGLVIGSEAHGISPEAGERLSARVAVPMGGGVESLNAAVSASILLYEAFRNRGSGDGPGTGTSRQG